MDAGRSPVASTSSAKILDPKQLLSAPGHSLSLPTIQASLEHLPDVARIITCANLILNGRIFDQSLLRRIVDIGLAAGEDELDLFTGDVRARLEGLSKSGQSWEGHSAEDFDTQVGNVLSSDEPRRNTVRSLAILQQARRRLDTYDAFHAPHAQENGRSTTASTQKPVDDNLDLDLDDPWAENDDDDEVPPILDDPWADQEDDEEPAQSIAPSQPEIEHSEPPLDPTTFLLGSVVLSALALAAGGQLSALRVVCQRHSAELWPYRFALVEAVPGWMSPADDDMLALLPSMSGDMENNSWPKGKVSIAPKFLDFLAAQYGLDSLSTPSDKLLPPKREKLLTGDFLSAWYISRVRSLDNLGLLDSQLAWVQHGASLGVPGLDAVGEDLSLLSRMIYDANLTSKQLQSWTLASWRSAEPDDIVRSLLSNSTPDSVVGDIRRLVLPYLYVLESRAERTGKPDPGLVERMLNGAILDLPLTLALPCFEASKATIRGPTRLIKDDQMVARLALACLYGSDQQNAWSTMSAIFECLPVWDVSGGDFELDKVTTATTLESIADFVRPSVRDEQPHDARQLYLFFRPLPFSSLSRAIDILDVHLESGEILSRWDVRVYLRTLLQSARDRDEQVTLAEKMVRRQRGIDERRWMQLWEDMCKLQGGNDQLLRGALGMLSREELMRIYLGGLLASGNFVIARKVLRRLEPEGYFSPDTLESVVLETSKEFYMRAETGNIHTGDMKLAYECLSIAPETPAIRAELDFVQATSRLTTFKGLSNLTPAEIRHTPNRLDLIRRVISTSDDAYRHTSIILELTDKLGYAEDIAARTEVLAMLVDAAVAAEEWDLARERVDQMAAIATEDVGEPEPPEAAKIRNVVWRSCLNLGKQAEYPDLRGRMALIAQAISLCPAEEVPALLPLYNALEDEAAAHPEKLHRALPTSPTSPTSASFPSFGEERMLGSRRAARAAKMAFDLGASLNLPSLRSMTVSPALGSARSASTLGERPSSRASQRGSSELNRERDVAGLFGGEEDVRAGARRALVKGVGWLLGADESEIEGP